MMGMNKYEFKNVSVFSTDFQKDKIESIEKVIF